MFKLTRTKTISGLIISVIAGAFVLFPVSLAHAEGDVSTITVNLIYSGESNVNFDLLIDGTVAGTGSSVGNGGTTGPVVYPPGNHTVSIDAGTSIKINFAYFIVTYGNSCPNGAVNLDSEQDVTCDITVVEKGAVNITKYNDLNHSGVKTSTDPVLSGWSILLDGSNAQTTDSNGMTSYIMVDPGQHTLGEVQQSGWQLSDINCQVTNADNLTEQVNSPQYGSTNPTNLVVDPGANLDCTIGNYQPPLVIAQPTVTTSTPAPQKLVNTGESLTAFNFITPLLVIALVAFINLPDKFYKKLNKTL